MAFEVLYSIVDAKGKSSTMAIALPQVTSFADVTIFAGQMALLIDPLINGRITRIGVGFTVSLPGALGLVSDADSDVEEGAKFQFKTSGGFFTGFRIPTFDEQFILSGTQQVDLAAPGVAALRTAMVSGINLTAAGGSGTIQPSDTRNEDITALEFAREMFQSSRGRA